MKKKAKPKTLRFVKVVIECCLTPGCCRASGWTSRIAARIAKLLELHGACSDAVQDVIDCRQRTVPAIFKTITTKHESYRWFVRRLVGRRPVTLATLVHLEQRTAKEGARYV